MSVESSQQTSNIQILQFGDITFPPQSTLKVDYVNRRKEGVGIVMSSMKIIIGKLNFHDDKLEGLSIFFDSTGMKSKEGLFVNGVHNGWGREYNDDKVVFEGIYRNGERYSELKKSSTDGYLDEVKDGKTLSIFKYNNNHIVEGKGWLFEYDGDRVTEVFECENGEKRIKRILFDNNQMIELNDNGRVVYRGGFTGNPRDGFLRTGEGSVFDDNDCVVYCGGWHNGYREGNGLLYDNGSLKYKGEWREDKPYGKGKFYNSDGEVVMERVWKNEYDDLENGVIRIDDTYYVDIHMNDVYLNTMDTLLKNSDKKIMVKELIINEGCENEMKDDLELCGFENLESIVVKKNSLKNLNSLKISDNPVVKNIEIEDGEWNNGDPTGAFYNVKNVTITSTLITD